MQGDFARVVDSTMFVSNVAQRTRNRLDFLLTGYPADLKHFLISGFSFGFRISYMGERQTFESRNLKTALEKPHIVLSKLNKEREAGRIAGPFSVPPFPIFHCSPLGIRSSQEGSFRISANTPLIIPPCFLCQ